MAVAVVGCGGTTMPPGAQRQPPERRAAVPGDVERYVHGAFHRLPRSCSRRRAVGAALDRTTARFIGLYRRYPAERFRMTIDDESGTMLSAILVLRDELASCSPRHAASIDAVLPSRIRRALPPPRGAGEGA